MGIGDLMHKWILLVFLFMSSLMSRSFSDINSDVCDFYFRGKSVEVVDVQDIFSKVASADAVKVCTSKSGVSAYYMASGIKVKSGVSYFHMTRIFREDAGNNKVRWNLAPPKNLLHLVTREVYMCDDASGCKKQNDNSFIQTGGVAISAFKDLSVSWGGIVDSKELFEKAVQDLSFRMKRSSSVKELKSALYGKGEAPKLFSLHFNQGDDSTFPKYTFSVMAGSDMWNIDFDFHPVDGVKFERVVLVED